MRSTFLNARSGQLSPLLLGIGAMGVLGGLYLHSNPLSLTLQKLASDGALEGTTAQFLDSLHYLLLFGALLCLVMGWSKPLRRSLADATRAPAHVQGEGRNSYWIPAIAGLAFAIRILVGGISDVGLGDDGARVAWLKYWLVDPRPVWWGLWAPGHLYLHALAWLVVRDAVRAGILISALACGGTAWLLGRSMERTWGSAAGGCAAAGVAFLPVGVAYGSVPDVCPVFSFLVVGAIAAAGRYVRTGGWYWLGLAWVAIAFASWSRFETPLLVPGIVAPFWPRPRIAIRFALLALVPTAVWHGLAYFAHGAAPNVLHTVLHDPWLRSRDFISNIFTFLGGLWQCLTLPFVIGGALGVLRALRSRRGREWVPVLALHLGAFVGMAVLTHAGSSPRYFILSASILAAYTGVWLGGVLERSRSHGVFAIAVVAALLVVAPPLYPGEQHQLWMRRNPVLRGVVDRVRELSAGEDVVWVSDTSAYFFPCRVPIPIMRYHALSRSDSDPAQLLDGMRGVETAVACVHESHDSVVLWDLLIQHGSRDWAIAPIESVSGYRLYRMVRQHP